MVVQRRSEVLLLEIIEKRKFEIEKPNEKRPGQRRQAGGKEELREEEEMVRHIRIHV